MENSAAEHAFQTQEIYSMSVNELWHCRLGHIGLGNLKEVSKIVDGLEGLTEFEGICESCVYSKAHRDISKVPMRKTMRKLERVHTDIWGPSPVPSITGSRYMLTLTDDYTWKSWTYFLH